MADHRAEIEVVLLDKISKQLDGITDNFRKSATEINSKLELVSKAWNLVEKSASFAIGVIGQSISVANEEIEAENRLYQSLRGTTDQREAALRNLQNYNTALEAKLGIDGSELAKIQSTLALRGVANKQLIEATRATLGLAEATGKSMNTAAIAVAKAYDGNFKSLQRLGLSADTVAEAKRKLAQTFELVESKSDTLATKTEVLHRSYENLLETIGRSANESGVLANSTSALTRVMNALGEEIRKDRSSFGDLGIAAGKVFKFIILGVRSVVDAVFEIPRFIGAAALALEDQFGKDNLDIISDGSKGFFDDLKGYMAGTRREMDFLTGGGTIDQLIYELDHLGDVTNKTGKETKKEKEEVQGLTGALEANLKATKKVKKEKEGKNYASQAQEFMQNSPYDQYGFEVMQAAEAEKNAADRQARIDRLRDTAGQNRADALRKQAADQLQRDQDTINARKEMMREAVMSAGSIGANAMAAFAEGFAGGGNIVQGFKEFTVNMLKQVGQMLIGLGTAALAMAALQAIPFLKPLVDPTGVAIPAALAAIGVGTALVAGGTILGGALGVGAPKDSGAGKYSGNFTGSNPARIRDVQSPRGGSTTEGAQTVVINFNGPVGGSVREIGRQISGIMTRHATLRGGA